MVPRSDNISEISPVKESWSIVVRIVCAWFVRDVNRDAHPFSLDMGNKIHATVRRTLIYKFEKDLQEGKVYSMSCFGVAANLGSYRTTKHEYKLNFQFNTKVKLCGKNGVPSDIYPISNPIAVFSYVGCPTILRKTFIGATVITGKNAGEKVIIPRMNVVPSDPGLPFKFTRRQFPLALCFAMTINKSQMKKTACVLRPLMLCTVMFFGMFNESFLMTQNHVDSPIPGEFAAMSGQSFLFKVIPKAVFNDDVRRAAPWR
ncbi:animal RPA1 domain protein [Medicago truncatula]|uniref:Animal RPA1 domain protein n=1 Tax=Medicago truncatula TaxID=3880 RepID=A0A072UFS9_MEDTR|nr:animal RPA1 domain protein [Medicago truncatula]